MAQNIQHYNDWCWFHVNYCCPTKASDSDTNQRAPTHLVPAFTESGTDIKVQN